MSLLPSLPSWEAVWRVVTGRRGGGGGGMGEDLDDAFGAVLGAGLSCGGFDLCLSVHEKCTMRGVGERESAVVKRVCRLTI